ncbi:MAG: DUF4276 family protein [Phycisphaerales bacterium]|nr:DUF4276 family protein [Phycisphaerales bacterium]
MVSEIRIYIEGGGDQRATKAALREGMGKFLYSLRERARQCGIRWNIVACGGRNSTFDAFKTAMRQHVHAFNVLLVDAEAPVSKEPWAYLHERDQWFMDGLHDEQCHLMVQCMEAWIIADIDALAHFYGQGFRRKDIPGSPNVEEIDKTRLADCLKTATRATRKGEYHKTRHAPQIVGLLNKDTVCQKASYCRRLFDTLIRKMENG